MSQERRNGDGVVLDARKSFVTSAGEADGYVVSTRWSEGKAPTESMLYLVLGSDAGVGVAGTWDALGMRGNASAPMTLREVSLPASRALTEPGQGMAMMLGAVLPIFNVGSAAISIGIAEAATAITQRHLTDSALRVQRHEALGPAQRAGAPGRRCASRPIARAPTSRRRSTRSSSRAPPPCSTCWRRRRRRRRAALTVTDTALRACGGTGFTKSLGLERAFRDARAAAVMAPTTDVLHEFVGRALCGMELL